MKSRIPIQNIFYMFCYSQGIFEESKKINIGNNDYKNDINYLASFLISCLELQIKKGLYRSYEVHSDEVSGIKGKLNISTSLQKNLFLYKKSSCDYDEYSVNHPFNQYIKQTLMELLKCKVSTSNLRSIKQLLKKFSRVDDRILTTINIHKNIYPRNFISYKLIHFTCYFIQDNLSLDYTGSKYQFIDYENNHMKLARLFEKFIYEFFKKEASLYFDTKRDRNKWQGLDTSSNSHLYFPTLETDIVLIDKYNQQKLIIDAKFCHKVLSSGRFDNQERLNSIYLRQLAVYLENEKRSTENIPRGMLLYPCVINSINITNSIWDYDVTIRTLSLHRSWKEIHQELLNILDSQFHSRIKEAG